MGENSFYFKEGREANNLKEFYEAIKDISEEEYSHHVNEDKNDFSEWVRHSLKNEKLADKLRDSGSLNEMTALIYDELSHDEPEEESKEEPKENNLETAEEKAEKEKDAKELTQHEEETPAQQTESKTQKANNYETALKKHSKLMLRELIFGTVLGIFLGMILMAILINLGVF